MDSLQEVLDARVLLQLWEVGRQLPEASGRVDRLCAQCQECFSKVEAHEVRLRTMCTNFESQDSRLKTLSDRIERWVAAEQGQRRGCDETILAGTEALTGRVDAHAQAIEELRANL